MRIEKIKELYTKAEQLEDLENYLTLIDNINNSSLEYAISLGFETQVNNFKSNLKIECKAKIAKLKKEIEAA